MKNKTVNMLKRQPSQTVGRCLHALGLPGPAAAPTPAVSGRLLPAAFPTPPGGRKGISGVLPSEQGNTSPVLFAPSHKTCFYFQDNPALCPLCLPCEVNKPFQAKIAAQSSRLAEPFTPVCYMTIVHERGRLDHKSANSFLPHTQEDARVLLKYTQKDS